MRTRARHHVISLSLVSTLFTLGCDGVVACPEGSEPRGERCVTSADAGPRADGGRGDGGSSFVIVDVGAPLGGDAAGPAPDAAGCALRTYHRDVDGDGRGDPTLPMTSCEAPEGWVLDATDCDDTCATCFPAADEVCDGVDQDCDAQIDEDVQRAYFRDADGDGHGLLDEHVLACVPPDGYAERIGDCDDTRAGAYPGAREVCNGLDDDCDHRADQTFACAAGRAVACTTACGTLGTVRCTAECTVPTTATCTPPVESCNGLDDDCDGWVDEGTRVFGRRLELGAAGRRIEVLPYAGGFVAVYQNEAGVRAQRLDASGGLVGREQSITGTPTRDFGAVVVDDTLTVVTHAGTDLEAQRFDLTPVIDRVAGPVRLGAGDVSATNRVRLVRTAGGLHVVFPARVSSTGSTMAVFVLTRAEDLTGTTPRFTALSMTTTSDDLDVAASPRHVLVASVLTSATSSQLNVTRIPGWATSGSEARFVSVPLAGATARMPQLAVHAREESRETVAVLYQRETASGASLRLAAVQVGADGRLEAGLDVTILSSGLPSSTVPSPADVVSLRSGRFGLGFLQPTSSSASTPRYFEANVPAAGAPTVRALDEGLVALPTASGSLALARRDDHGVLLGLSSSGTTTAGAHLLACR
jgi:hypothetical protein